MGCRIEFIGIVAASLCLGGCGNDAGRNNNPGSGAGAGYGYGYGDSAQIQFRDDVATNAKPDDVLLNLEFLDSDGKRIAPKDFVGKKNLVLVMTRGYNGSICPFCSTYTSSLITNYKAIVERDAEVVVVYPIEKPGDSGRLAEFLNATFKRSTPAAIQAPFPVVLDVQLKAVEMLGIRRDLSKPATYILDKQGKVRFAYVGNSLADRPSIKVILAQLDALKPKKS